MPQNPSVRQKEINFYFSRSKAAHTENGECCITLFARLSVEVYAGQNAGPARENKTVWVDIEEVKGEQVTEKMKRMPDSINRYKITEELFWELYQISQTCPQELYYLTPLSHLHDYSNNR